MLVLKEHGHVPSSDEQTELLKIVKKLFGTKAKFRGYMSSYCPEHWHQHIIQVE